MMSEDRPIPASLRQVVGALIFGSDHPLSVNELRKVLRDTDTGTPESSAWADPPVSAIQTAVLDLRNEFARLNMGVELVEVAGGFRMQTQPECSPWMRQLLRLDRPNRLSRPALETLAVIAYRQPITRADIEGIRGVAVGHVLRNLTELRLVKIAGRSELPGRPFLYGTTAMFLEYFGLGSLKELDDMDPSLRGTRNVSKRLRPENPADPSEETRAADEEKDSD